MITLQIYLLNGFDYSTQSCILPIAAILTTDENLEVAEKIDVEEIGLSHLENEDIGIGAYTKCALGTFRYTFELTPVRPRLLVYDIWRYDFYRDVTLIPGEYKILLRLKVYQKAEDGKFIKHVLEATHRVQLVQ